MDYLLRRNVVEGHIVEYNPIVNPSIEFLQLIDIAHQERILEMSTGIVCLANAGGAVQENGFTTWQRQRPTDERVQVVLVFEGFLLAAL